LIQTVATGRARAKEKAMSPSGPDAAMAPDTHPAAVTEPRSPRTPGQVVKDIGLFLAGPFVTLAYLACCPFVAMKLLEQERRRRKQGG
jgi:hypothetical protein